MSSIPYEQKGAPEETEKYEAFDRLTEALEYIDNFHKSQDKPLLDKADECLGEALEEDPNYFKAQYFRAMVSYLKGNTTGASEEFKGMLGMLEMLEPTHVKPETASEESKGKLESTHVKPLANEIRYNLAAAYSESEQWKEAIDYFNEVIKETPSDSELHLLARAGLAKTYAARMKAGATTSKDKDSAKIEEQYDEIRKILEPSLFERLFGPPKKKIDKKVATTVKELINEARGQESFKSSPTRWSSIVKSKWFMRIAIVGLLVLLFGLVAAVIVSFYLYGAIQKP